MYCASIFFLLVAAATAFPNVRQVRMIGGQPAKVGSLPYVVSIRREGSKIPIRSCLGSIIDPQWILSSALCLQEESTGNVAVYPGVYEHTPNPQTPHFHTDKIVIHPAFDGTTGKNDLALVHLSQPLQISQNVSPIEIGQLDNGKGTKVTAIGWNEDASTGLNQGKPEPYRLGTLPLTITTIDQCQKEFPQLHSLVDLGETQICTYPGKGNDLCGVDSGAPLVDENTGKQVGVVNDVIFFASGHNHQCHPDHDHPLLFTKLDAYKKWIGDTTKIKV